MLGVPRSASRVLRLTVPRERDGRRSVVWVGDAYVQALLRWTNEETKVCRLGCVCLYFRGRRGSWEKGMDKIRFVSRALDLGADGSSDWAGGAFKLHV